MEYPFGLVNLLGLLPLGVAWLVAVRLIFSRRSSEGDDLMQRGMTLAGWLMVLVGVFGLLCVVVGPAALFVWPVMLAILSMAIGRFRHNERRSLLWALAAAAERGIPLDQAAHAFADERHDETGLRAARLAKLLAGGGGPDALRSSYNFLPFDGKLACGIGWQAGCLGPALRRVVDDHEELDQYLQGLIEKVFYLCLLAGAFFLVTAFLMVAVVPALGGIYSEFTDEIPWMTEAVLDLSNSLTIQRGWVFLVPMYFLVFATFIVLLVYYLSWVTWEPWIVRRLWRRLHTAWILRHLAFLVAQHRPLEQAVRLLSANYPATYIAQRLYRATGMMSAGYPWCDALVAQRLIRAGDAGVLRAAERAGNLAWAMDEVAESNLRRLGLRFRSILNVAFPLVIVLFGGLVFMLVVSLYLPFPLMLQKLSAQ